jgi:hypothetical protein
MVREQQPSDGPGKGRPEKDKTDGNDGAVTEDSCRCKEVAKKTLPEMLKLMVSDLAFWKKSGKRR